MRDAALVTTKEIAATLGVAVSTVGRALADDPRISPATKKRVNAAAARLGYVGNTPARVMRGGSSRLIGLIVPDVLNDFYATIAQELSENCDAAGYQLTLSINGDQSESELKHVRELVASRVAGIVIVPTAAPRPQTMKLLAATPHVQLLRRLPALKSDWFGIRDETAVAEATAHLIACGHRRIAYVGGSEALPTGRDRLAGYRDAHRAARHAPTPGLAKLGPPTAVFGREATAELLMAKPRPTGLVFGSIQATMGGLRAIREAGVRVPAELSVIGFGDPIWFEWWGPGLTTLHLPIRELAQACSERFLARLVDGKAMTGKAYLDARSAVLLVRGSVEKLR